MDQIQYKNYKSALTWAFVCCAFIPWLGVLTNIISIFADSDSLIVNFLLLLDGEMTYLVIMMIAILFGFLAIHVVGKKVDLNLVDTSDRKFSALGWDILSLIFISEMFSAPIVGFMGSVDNVINASVGLSASNYNGAGMTSIIQFVTTSLIGPLLEEVLFRYIIFKLIRPFGAGTAIMVSTLCFAISHSTAPQVISILLVTGIIWGFIYEKCGLKATFIAHAATNTVVTTLSNLQITELADIFFTLEDILAIASIIYFFVSRLALHNDFIKDACIDAKSNAKIILKVPMFWNFLCGCIVVCSFYTVIYGISMSLGVL